jgi:hypothetical protein
LKLVLFSGFTKPTRRIHQKRHPSDKQGTRPIDVKRRL